MDQKVRFLGFLVELRSIVTVCSSDEESEAKKERRLGTRFAWARSIFWSHQNPTLPDGSTGPQRQDQERQKRPAFQISDLASVTAEISHGIASKHQSDMRRTSR